MLVSFEPEISLGTRLKRASVLIVTLFSLVLFLMSSLTPHSSVFCVMKKHYKNPIGRRGSSPQTQEGKEKYNFLNCSRELNLTSIPSPRYL